MNEQLRRQAEGAQRSEREAGAVLSRHQRNRENDRARRRQDEGNASKARELQEQIDAAERELATKPFGRPGGETRQRFEETQRYINELKNSFPSGHKPRSKPWRLGSGKRADWDLTPPRSSVADPAFDAMVRRRMTEMQSGQPKQRGPQRRRGARRVLTREEREAAAVRRTMPGGVRAAGPDSLAELRGASDGMPYLAGYGVVFDVWTEINSMMEGTFLERIRPGAARKSLAENGENVKVMFQHGGDFTTGEKPLCTPTFSEDHNGVKYEGQLYDTQYCRELIPALEGGQLGASFKFRVIQETFEDEPEPSEDNPKGLPERTVDELELFEMGPVVFGAYPTATAGVLYARPPE